MAAPDDILDQLTSAVLVLDSNLTVTYLNQPAESLCGQSAAHCLGEVIGSVIRDPHVAAKVLHECLASGQPFTKRETAIEIVATGERVTANYSISPISESELLVEIEALDRILRINRDGHNVALYRTTRQLARGLAHEVKNPLGGIRGAAQLLRGELGDPSLQEYTDVIITEVDRLRNLVDRMLGPNEAPNFQPVNVHEVLERVVRVVEAEAGGADAAVAFERTYDPSVPEIDADPELLVQAILNVVRNARSALADTVDPKIKLATRVVRQFTIGGVRHRLVAQIAVADNGPGIPSEIAEWIFYPMISGKADGTGLGLAIAQTISGQHRGVIDCVSEPGDTTFHIHLPLTQPKP